MPTDVSYVPDDIVAGMLSFFKGDYFTSDPERIHETIAKARVTYRILEVFPFSKDDAYPFSRLLERVLARLQVSRIIGMDNPTYDRYAIKEEGRKLIKEEILPFFDKEQQEQIRELATYFESECGIS